MAGEIKDYYLDNGLHVGLLPQSSATVAGVLNINLGGLNEEPGEEGLVHLLEHTLVLGASKNFSKEDSLRRWNSFQRGGLQVYSGPDTMEFCYGSKSNRVEDWLEWISDKLFRPKFDDETFYQQRDVIERESVEKRTKADKDFLDFYEVLYPNSPLTYDLLGDPEVIRNATKTSLRRILKRGVNPTNMELILAGGLPDDVEAMIETYFGSQKPGNIIKYQYGEAGKIADLSRGRVIWRAAPELLSYVEPEKSAAHFLMGFRIPDFLSPEWQAISALDESLGGGPESLLFQELREREGYAYRIGSNAKGTMPNHGRVEIQGMFLTERLDEAVARIFDIFQHLGENGISERDLNRVKEHESFGVDTLLESNEGLVTAMMNYFEYGIHPLEALERVEALTPDDVRDVAVKHLPNNPDEDEYVILVRDPHHKEQKKVAA